ncbi:HNH endonuclease [Polycladomyces abyssicola]|nr:HNH endonuclease [Polycladomyces abyssicola]
MEKQPNKFTWHHHQEPGKMQLVHAEIHRATNSYR